MDEVILYIKFVLDGEDLFAALNTGWVYKEGFSYQDAIKGINADDILKKYVHFSGCTDAEFITREEYEKKTEE